ncbi:signal peptidase II [Fodinisporobacter ferrooxydans]|uniref:Lipoprotein signal peptidase n=1 Tax=Fodinisporobacter ferrooxydans TaxID=2901836 RepID=A0ABY4CF69_9BACL|nr:signal peptidase II [Alicyclobacillaceae bacterium MYW30-H2]
MFVYIIAIVVIAIDQWLKFLVKFHMQEGQTIPILEPFVSITSIRNPGAAFGMLQNQTWLFILIACAVIVAGIVFERRTSHENRTLLRLAIGLLVGGAIGNLVDRILYKTVVDYVNVQIFVFNFADAAITFAVIFFLIDALFRDGKQTSNSQSTAKDEVDDV